jgi:hypothetical protein
MDLKQLSSEEVVGLTIIGEGRGEPIESQVAIGSVIRNRVNHWKNSYNDTCLAKMQFSCWNTNDPNYAMLNELAGKLLLGQEQGDIYIVQCLYVGVGIVTDKIRDNTNNSLYYMTSSLFNSDKKPAWSHNAKNTKVIGNHTYFSL